MDNDMNQRPKILDIDQRILSCIVGIIIGLFLYKSFLEPETKTTISYREKITIDTVYSHSVDTVYLTKKEIKQTVIRDTVLIKQIEPKIKAFTAVYPLQYGNATVNGEVLGEVLKMGLTTDFNIPVVTNTIEKETVKTIVKKPSGLYVSGWVNSNFTPSLGGTYLKDRFILNYKYTPLENMHSVGIGLKVF
jgi:hypothetical protein